MNARALKIGVASQNARRCLIISLTALLLLTLCINTARSATLTWTAIAGGIWSDANNWSPNQVPACGDNIIVPNSGTCAVTDSFTMLPTNDLLCHYRIRTRSRLDTYFQNDFTVTLNYHRLLNSSGIIVAEDDAAQTVIFLNTATARGHPWSGDQSLYLFDNALDRPAQHFCSAPASLRVPFSRFIVSPQRDLPAHPIIHGKQSLGLACCSHFPVKYNPTVHLKELL